MLSRGRVLVLALERRVNFDMEQLRAVSTGYAQFQSHVCRNLERHGVLDASTGAHRLCRHNGCCVGLSMPSEEDEEARELVYCCDSDEACARPFVARQLSTSHSHLPQYFEYHRVKELEVWELWRT